MDNKRLNVGIVFIGDMVFGVLVLLIRLMMEDMCGN